MGEINEFPIFHHVLLAFSMNSRRYGSSMSMGWPAKTMPPSWMDNGGVRLVLCSLPISRFRLYTGLAVQVG